MGSDEGTWLDIAQFEVHSNEVEHTFTLVGDPQLSPSGNLQSDGAGWQRVLDANDDDLPDADRVGALANTGANIMWTVAIGLAALAIGLVLFLVKHNRLTHNHHEPSVRPTRLTDSPAVYLLDPEGTPPVFSTFESRTLRVHAR